MTSVALTKPNPPDADAPDAPDAPIVAAAAPVALVSMPSLSGRFPSFQLALLKPTLERAGIGCQTFSLFMYFGRHVGWPLNEMLAEVWPSMIGEWIWAKAAFPDDERVEGAFLDDELYVETFAKNFRSIEERTSFRIDDIKDVRDRLVPSFLDWCVASTDWSRFRIVGFSVVFQQTLASLALARRLKEAHPHLTILFGGGGFEDDIADEIFQKCPYIDLLHCGDADVTLPELTKRVLDGESMRGQRGVYWRDDKAASFEGRAPNLEDLNRTPIPDFDEYFFAQEQSKYVDHAGSKEVMLPIETARGCWWGEKHHCTFCGLNRQGMAFRKKDAGQVLDMVSTLHAKYGMRTFDAIDNIVSPDYVDGLFGKLADSKCDYRFHYEVRPTLTRDKLRTMRNGGLYSVQPGIESLNTHVLQLMNKRTTGMKNLEFIKWCTYYGIHNLYNILLGFPGELVDDFDEQIETMRRVPHFQPPKFITKARADRGSPMFERPEEHAITAVRPAKAYRFLYPKRFSLKKVSYYFEHSMGRILDDEQTQPLFDAVATWQQRWASPRRPSLTYEKGWNQVVVNDTRARAPKRTVLTGNTARVFEALLDAKRAEQVAAELELGVEEVSEILASLDAQDLVRGLDHRFLALPLPVHAGH